MSASFVDFWFSREAARLRDLADPKVTTHEYLERWGAVAKAADGQARERQFVDQPSDWANRVRDIVEDSL